MLPKDALRTIYPLVEDKIVVTIMGALPAELYALGHRKSFFYVEHSMGLASSIGLGLALCLPHEKVIVFDGDGSVLMNLGGLTTVASSRPRNLVHIIFDNQSFLSTGGSPTATASGTDLAAIARAAGYPTAVTVRRLDELCEAVTAAVEGDDLACIVAKVDAVAPASFHMDLGLLENRFEFARALRSRVKA